MNIDYAKIIETADKRRTVLQELEELLKGYSSLRRELYASAR